MARIESGTPLRRLKICIVRFICDIVRKMEDEGQLEAEVTHELMLARRVHAGNSDLDPVLFT